MAAQSAPTLPFIPVTDEERAVLWDYQRFLAAHRLDRHLICTRCGHKADPGTGDVGFACQCRVLVWRPL